MATLDVLTPSAVKQVQQSGTKIATIGTTDIYAPTPTAVNNPTITIEQGGTTKGSFTLNQTTDQTISLDVGGGASGMALIMFEIDSAQNYSCDNENTYVQTPEFTFYPRTIYDGQTTTYNVIAKDSRNKENILYATPTTGQLANRSFAISIPPTTVTCVRYIWSDKWTGLGINESYLAKGETRTVSLSSGDVIKFFHSTTCLPYDTPIRMADGSEKRICGVRVGDLVASVDPATGNLSSDEVVQSDADTFKTAPCLTEWTFDDGSTVRTVNRHRLYNADLGEMMYMEAWLTGERGRKEDGSRPRLVSSRKVCGAVRHCTLFTKKWNNYFASGFLCGNRMSAKITEEV